MSPSTLQEKGTPARRPLVALLASVLVALAVTLSLAPAARAAEFPQVTLHLEPFTSFHAGDELRGTIEVTSRSSWRPTFEAVVRDLATGTVNDRAIVVDDRFTLLPQGESGTYEVQILEFDSSHGWVFAQQTFEFDAAARQQPMVTATLISSTPVNAAGWYRSPVKVNFACATPGDILTTACPKPVALRHGRHAATTHTITTLKGGPAFFTVPAINVDLKAPQVRLVGLSKLTSTAHVTVPATPTCAASDATSGLKSCRVTTKRRGQKIAWTAKAVDVAGNTATATGSVTLVRAALADAKVVNGAARVKAGKAYTLRVRSTARPTLDGVKFTRVAANQWATTVRLPKAKAGKVVTLKPKAGAKTFPVKVKVVR